MPNKQLYGITELLQALTNLILAMNGEKEPLSTDMVADIVDKLNELADNIRKGT